MDFALMELEMYTVPPGEILQAHLRHLRMGKKLQSSSEK